MAKEDCKQCEMLLSAELREIKSMILRLDNAIRGNGTEGLVTRVAKNELRHKLLIWVVSTEAALVLAILGKLIYNHLTPN